jgi:branched-chain amino acid transport system ATP-binding protein
MTTLSLQSVSKKFGGVTAAQDVTIDVTPGQITGLIGPNGAGKSTLVNLITGMLTVSSGTIRFGERDITETDADEIARLGFARTFQNIRLFKEAPVIDNLLIGFHKLQSSSVLSNILGLAGARRESARIRDQAHGLRHDPLRRFPRRWAGLRPSAPRRNHACAGLLAVRPSAR